MSTVHNPTHFNPADYEVEDYLDNKRPQYYGQSIPMWELEIKDWEADMARTFGADWRAKIHHCVHCGNGNVRWITAVRHTPTGDVVVFGSDCTERLAFPNTVAFKLALLKSRAEATTERFKIWNLREKFLADHPDFKDAIASIDEPVHAKNAFAKDVIAKLGQYGSLSDKQMTAVVASLKRDAEYEARKAVEATEVKGDAPTGRVAVTGVVLSLKEQESQYGFTTKMLVKLTNNSRVWLTAPSKATIERGDTITIKATWEPSKDDKSFGFGKRPTLVSRTPVTPVPVEPVHISGVNQQTVCGATGDALQIGTAGNTTCPTCATKYAAWLQGSSQPQTLTF